MRALIIGLAISVSAALPVHAEVVQAGPGGFVVRYGAAVAATPEEAWATLLKPADWWQSDHTFSGSAANLWIDSQATGCFCEKLTLPKDAPEGRRPGSVEHMRVIYAEPPRALRMVGSLGPLQSEALVGTMTFSIAPGAKGGTRILMEYVVGGFMRMKPEEISGAVDKVLGAQFAALTGKLSPASAEPEPAPPKRVLDLPPPELDPNEPPPQAAPVL